MEPHQRKSWNRNSAALLSMMAVTVLGLVTGCTDMSTPVQTADTLQTPQSSTPAATSPAPSPTPTAKPSPTPIPASSKGPAQNWPTPDLPEIAKQRSIEGAEAFAKYYFEAIYYSVVTNKSESLKKATTRNCEVCGKQFIDPADANNRDGGWNYGGEYALAVAQVKLQENNYADVTFELEQDALFFMYSDGTEYGRLPATTKPTLGVLVMKFDEGWRVDDITYAES